MYMQCNWLLHVQHDAVVRLACLGMVNACFNGKLVTYCVVCRIGRSGRFGRKGVAINFVIKDDERLLQDLQHNH